MVVEVSPREPRLRKCCVYDWNLFVGTLPDTPILRRSDTSINATFTLTVSSADKGATIVKRACALHRYSLHALWTPQAEGSRREAQSREKPQEGRSQSQGERQGKEDETERVRT